MQQTNLQIAPNGVKPIINVSQFDVGRQFKIKLYDGAVAYTPPAGTSIRIDGVKPDGHGFSYTENVSLSGSVVTVTTTTQMTIVEGTVNCELRLSLGDDDIGTLNFDMIVERSPINEDTDLSETEVPVLVTLARAQMENAEAWANGTRGGDPVTPSDPAYHNNAKYWSDQASEVAVDMVGATSETNGAHGLVPAPQAGDQDKVLKGDGTWGTISTTLSGLTDTDISNPTAGQVLSYDNSKWGNTSLGTAAAKDATDTLSSGSTDLIEAGAVYTANETLTNQVKDMNNVLGAKNLLPNNIVTQVKNGITFTVNDDGSIRLTGTATDNTAINLPVDLTDGVTYTASGVSGGSSSTYVVFLQKADGTATSAGYFGDGEITFTKNSGQSAPNNYDVHIYRIRVSEGATVDTVIYPMIRIASITDNTYVPYAKSNRELTDDIDTVSSQISDLTTVTQWNLTFNDTYFDPTNSSNYAIATQCGKVATIDFRGALIADLPSGNYFLTTDGTLPIPKIGSRVMGYGTINNSGTKSVGGQFRITSNINYPFNEAVATGAILDIHATYIIN